MYKVHDRSVEHLSSVLFQRLIRLVLSKIEMLGCEYSGISRNTRCLVISLGDTSIYDEDLAAGLDRLLSVLHLDRNMSVEYPSGLRVEAEFLEDLVSGLFLVEELIVRNLVLLVC